MSEPGSPLLTSWPFTCIDCAQRFDEGSMSYSAGVRGLRICVNCYKYALAEKEAAQCLQCFLKHEGECW